MLPISCNCYVYMFRLQSLRVLVYVCLYCLVLFSSFMYCTVHLICMGVLNCPRERYKLAISFGLDDIDG